MPNWFYTTNSSGNAWDAITSATGYYYTINYINGGEELYPQMSDEELQKMADYFKKQEEEREQLKEDKMKYPLFFLKDGIV